MARDLTAVAVAKMRPEDQRHEVPDGACRGLYLIVQPSGSKSWALRYRRPHDGRSAKLALGPVSDVDTEPTIGAPMTLAAVRRLVTELKHQIARGVDPGIRKQEEAAGLFVEGARAYCQHARRTTCRWRDTSALLGLREGFDVIPHGICDRWRGKRVDEVTEDDCFHAIDDARHRGTPGLVKRPPAEPSEARARVMHAALSSMFGWLLDRRKIKTNPLANLKRPAQSRPRDRVLTDDEIRSVWQATDRLLPPHRAAIRLMLVTGQRREEVAGMTRGELDGTTWNLPGARTKNHRPHAVPLSPLAMGIIGSLTEHGEFVFTTTGTTPISGWSKVKRRLDKMVGFDDWRLHDLRRTAVTGMARAGADLAVIERAVNHVSGSFAGIVETYQRHTYSDEVRRALEAWAELLMSIIRGA